MLDGLGFQKSLRLTAAATSSNFSMGTSGNLYYPASASINVQTQLGSNYDLISIDSVDVQAPSSNATATISGDNINLSYRASSAGQKVFFTCLVSCTVSLSL